MEFEEVLIGFEFTRADGEKDEKVFVPLDKILYVTEMHYRDLITNKKTKPSGAKIHLLNGHSMLVEENYSDIINKWLEGKDN